MNNGYFEKGNRGQINVLSTLCSTSTQEETRENMMSTVKYKESIENDSSYVDVHEMLKEVAMSFGMKDYTRNDVEKYLLKDDLTSLVYCKGIDTVNNVTPIVDTLLTGKGWHSVDLGVYSELINTSLVYKDVMNKHKNVEYVDCETLHNTNIRKQVTSGDKLYYEVIGEDERFSTYEKIKMFNKMKIIDTVLENKTKKDWLEVIKDTIHKEPELEIEKFKREDSVEDSVDDYIHVFEDKVDVGNNSAWYEETPVWHGELPLDFIGNNGDSIEWI